MKLSAFDYTLPKELIAQYPLKQRDKSRMLILDKSCGRIEHRNFYELPDYLSKSDCIVLNDTKVFKARLIGRRKGCTGKVELLLLKEKNDGIFECLAKPAKKLTAGCELEFGNGKLKAEVLDVKGEFRYIGFNHNNNLYSLFERVGFVPLPPYIRRGAESEDETRYQTVYAKRTGAIAAPTAGLHFTNSIIKKIRQKGANIAYITLHVGYPTFRPIKANNIAEHRMHSEYFEIQRRSAETINRVRQKNGRVLAVGTTVCRALESAAVNNSKQYTVNCKQGETGLFIYPGYRFKTTDMLLTNFHLPKTTLLMLACAFGGYENIMKAYREAVERRYRFYSYGDCMLIL